MTRKIGIMSMQRIANYGSFLQAYGLKTMIENIGLEVEFVDYEYEKPIRCKKNKIFYKIKNNLNFIRKHKIRKEWNKFQKKYQEYIKTYFDITDDKNIRPQNIEALVIGSDEVFNCMQEYPVGYSRELFGHNYEKISVISYAASFGFTTFEMLKEYKINDEILTFLKKFKSLSLRDNNSYNIVKKIGIMDVEMHLDPVLVSNLPIDKKVNYENYIIVYTYSGRLTNNEEKYIKQFAKKNNKKIISLGFYQPIADYNLIVDPFEVLSYFKCADFIITDTFHGTIFSIKSNNKFCTIIRESNKNKLIDLLQKLKQEDRIAKELSDIDKLYKQKINYKITNQILTDERQKSIDYLKDNLKV